MTSPGAALHIERLQRGGWLFSGLLIVFFATAGVLPACAQTGRSSQQAQELSDAAQTSRQVSWKLLGSNVLHDQKRIWLFPKSLAQGNHWLPTLGMVGATVGLIALDPHDTPYFRRTQAFDTFNNVMSSRNTILGMAVVPASVYAMGLARHDSYMQKTVQLSAESALDSEILGLVIRDVTRRVPPKDIARDGDFSDSFFQRHKGPFYVGNGGFPSGHTLAAFSIATIFAERYRRHRWVPWAAYGLATLVGFSRITGQDHFPSDVFVGAALGFTIGHFVVPYR
ncbi:MAG: phosphatase PAP2 family protein [Acidobacteria bacterium]|nr:MAG: phosphatase PAP2 family protein [Acidobacteriota bacterium]